MKKILGLLIAIVVLYLFANGKIVFESKDTSSCAEISVVSEEETNEHSLSFVSVDVEEFGKIGDAFKQVYFSIKSGEYKEFSDLVNGVRQIGDAFTECKLFTLHCS